ncbi:MAG: hypothetical protein HY738_02265 [Bacteroidia bacterium]|nr:hypothetical protein [Bacteroidia bacterium]
MKINVIEFIQSLPTRRERKRTTNLTKENEFENEIRNKWTDCKDKRFSFFADQLKRKAESRHTYGTLPFARNTSHRFAKVKEPNLLDAYIIIL